MNAIESISIVGDFIFGTTTVLAKGVGILALQASHVSHFQEYESIAKKDFTLIQEQVYEFKENENGSISCIKELKENRNKENITISKGDNYKITSIDYIGQFDDNSNNNMAERITLQIGEDPTKIVIFDLDEKDYGVSVKSRIDLLELCR